MEKLRCAHLAKPRCTTPVPSPRGSRFAFRHFHASFSLPSRTPAENHDRFSRGTHSRTVWILVHLHTQRAVLEQHIQECATADILIQLANAAQSTPPQQLSSPEPKTPQCTVATPASASGPGPQRPRSWSSGSHTDPEELSYGRGCFRRFDEPSIALVKDPVTSQLHMSMCPSSALAENAMAHNNNNNSSSSSRSSSSNSSDIDPPSLERQVDEAYGPGTPQMAGGIETGPDVAALPG